MSSRGSKEQELRGQFVDRSVKLMTIADEQYFASTGAHLQIGKVPRLLLPPLYEAYDADVGGQHFGLVHATSLVPDCDSRYAVKYRDGVVLTFRPEPEDHLRVVAGIRKPELPQLEVYSIDWKGYNAILRFNPDHIQRTNGWARLLDFWDQLSTERTNPLFETQRGVSRILSTLTERLSGVAGSVTPVHPQDWTQIAINRFEAASKQRGYIR